MTVSVESQLWASEVLNVTRWGDQLFSFTLTRPPGYKFEAGQFARIGLKSDQIQSIRHEDFNPEGQEQIFRAYSIVSSIYDETLEFFSVTVPDGSFTSRLSHLQVGDEVLIDKTPFGFLTLSRYQQPEPDDLWLIATGTGAAPFISMLQGFEVWSHYRRVVFIYGARFQDDLVYFDQLEALAEPFQDEWGGQFIKVASVTREVPAMDGICTNQRITELLSDDDLLDQIGFKPSSTSHVMLCGNPQMIKDVKQVLKDQGLSMNRRGVGNIAVENYW